MKQTKIIKYILIVVIMIISLFSAKILISFIPEKGISDNTIQENQDIQDGEVEEIDQDSLPYTEETIGKLKIPKLEIEAEIKEGIDLETLANSIGHFKNSSLWDGNVALASHNRGSSVAHYFEGIHLLDVGDEIIYITNMGERRYQVFSQKEISNTDWSVTLNTDENIITLITCVTGQPEKRLCVQAEEV